MLLPPLSSITHCGLNQGFHMETDSSQCILVPRKEVFARTLRFLTSTANHTSGDSTFVNVYNEECYIICANVDHGSSIEPSSINAVVPCTCHMNGDSECPGESFITKLNFDRNPLIGIKETDYYIHTGFGGNGSEGVYNLYKKSTSCKCKALGTKNTIEIKPNVENTVNEIAKTTTGKNDSTTINSSIINGVLNDSKLIASLPSNDSLILNASPIDYFVKQIYSHLKPTSYHVSPSQESRGINICHMTLDSNEFEDKVEGLSDSTKYDTTTDVYIVWYKNEAKFFTLSRDQISNVDTSFVDIIRSGDNFLHKPEFIPEIVRGAVPFDRNSSLPCMVTKWAFNDYIQCINSHANSLLGMITKNLTSISDYLKFYFIWDEHSFSLLTLVYVRQSLEDESIGSCLVSKIWQPSIITPNSIDLTFKNALISVSLYLESKPHKTTNDYYIYQGLPSGNVNLSGLGMLELDSLANSGGSSPKSPSYNTRAVKPIFPSWWSFYAQGKGSDKAESVCGSNSPNSRLQRYIGALSLDLSQSNTETRPDSPANANQETNLYGSNLYDSNLKLEMWDNECALPEKLFSAFTIKPKEESTLTPNRLHCEQEGELSLSCSRSTSYDEGLSSTAYASSQSCDKSLSPVLNLSTNTISNDNSPSISRIVDNSPNSRIDNSLSSILSISNCASCSQFGAFIIPILSKDSVISFNGNAASLLDYIFSYDANKLDDALFETKVEDLTEELATQPRPKIKAKIRGAGSKKLVGAAGVTAKSLKDALKTCETLKQTIRRKLPFSSSKVRGVKQARESIERAFLALNTALDGVAKVGQRLSDAVASVLEELKEEDLNTPKAVPEKDSPSEWVDTTYDTTCTTFLREADNRQCKKNDKVLSDTISSHIVLGGVTDELVFFSPSFIGTDIKFSWEESQPVEQRRQWMLCSVECGNPLTRSKTKKQLNDKRSSPREARANRTLRKRHGEEEYEEYDFETDFEEAKAKRAKKLSPRAIDYASSNQKTLVPMGPLPIGVYFDASRKLWRCQWRENGKFKTKGFSLSHYKSLADARHACILYRCEVGNMTVQPEWLNPVFVQVGSLAHKKVAGKIE